MSEGLRAYCRRLGGGYLVKLTLFELDLTKCPDFKSLGTKNPGYLVKLTLSGLESGLQNGKIRPLTFRLCVFAWKMQNYDIRLSNFLNYPGDAAEQRQMGRKGPGGFWSVLEGFVGFEGGWEGVPGCLEVFWTILDDFAEVLEGWR